MSESRRSSAAAAAAVDEYLRAMRATARDQAVAEAEEEVCRAWTEELARVRRVTEHGVASARAASRAAQLLVREQQRIGELTGLTRAQEQLELAKGQERRSDRAAHILLSMVADETELLDLAAEERDTVALANRIWLSSAGRAVCEVEVGELRAAADDDEGEDAAESGDPEAS